jgi:methyltransferase family protein
MEPPRPGRDLFLRLLPQHSVGAELGVFRGTFTRKILEVVRPRELHLIDVWWERFGDHFPDWGPYTDFGRLSTHAAHAEVEAIAAEHAATTKSTIHVGDDRQILASFPDGYFDWVYLDTSHSYEDTVAELEILRLKVRPDGLITGDDWVPDPNLPHHGVYRATTEFCRRYGWQVRVIDACRQWCIGSLASLDA